MKFILLYCIFSFTFSASGSLSPEDILQKASRRLDGINHEFSVLMETKKGKKNKSIEFKVMVHWPEEGDILRETRILPLNSKKKKPTSYWEQLFKNGRETKRWMSMPITGKLKDVSQKKAGKKSFSFDELEITSDFIQSAHHQIIGEDSVNDTKVIIIESEKSNEKGSTKLWIDTSDYFIHKAEFYSKTGRLYRSIHCLDLLKIEAIQFPSKILVKNLKSKSEIHLAISNFSLNPAFDTSLFTPVKQ